MNARRWLVGLGLTLYAIAGVIAVAYLAGGLWMVANKMLPIGVEWDTWLSVHRQLETVPQQQGRVYFALIASLVLVFVVPPLAVAKLLDRERPTYGDARFAHPGEIRKAGLMGEHQGIIVGRIGGRYLIFGGQQFVMMSAPTRSGKGVGIVIPNLLNWADSAVVTDIKLENFEKTSGFRRASGHEVYLFAPFSETGQTHGWNVFDTVSDDPRLRVGELLAIGFTIYPSEGEGNDSRFWNEQARNLFLGLALYLKETPDRLCSFGEILREGSGRGMPLRQHLAGIIQQGQQTLSSACLDALNRVVSMSDNTLSSVAVSFSGPLTIFANPLVDAATSRTDIDVAAVRQRPMTIYLGIPPNRLTDASLLLNLFYAQLINLNTKVLPERDKSLQHQCLLLMDEFTAMGRLGVLPKAVGYIAGYNLRLLPVIQNVAQLRSTYGENDARVLMANHALHIVFATRELRDANEISESLGYQTEKRESRSRSYPRGFREGGNVSVSEREQRRALMLPQEIRELDPSKAIVLLEGVKPILCDKIRYYEDPVFEARLYTPCQIPTLPTPDDTAGDQAEASDAVDAASESLPTIDAHDPKPDQIDAVVEHAVTGRGVFAPTVAAATAAPAGQPNHQSSSTKVVWDQDLLALAGLASPNTLSRASP